MTNSTQHDIIPEHSNIGNLVGYGAMFGTLHILTGPDHIAAMVTISANKGYKAFLIGVQWGFGHSIGLLIIFAILLTIDDNILEKTYVAEWIVGFFLIFLGFLGYYRTYKYYKQKTIIYNIQEETTAIVPYQEQAKYKIYINKYKNYINKYKYLLDKHKILSLITGILHGLAGPGGVLGVLPAILLNDKEKSAAYLGTFCTIGIITMGTFSALWGELSKQIGKKFDIIILGTSSSLSIIIGIIWISLLATDNMETVFGH